ncbi:MAG: hypothetical protein FJX52_01845 [Alphaproteobacteria bacterium]|nr:hypothetical protein [Alphaproteobacteria bacterium]
MARDLGLDWDAVKTLEMQYMRAQLAAGIAFANPRRQRVARRRAGGTRGGKLLLEMRPPRGATIPPTARDPTAREAATGAVSLPRRPRR